MSISLQPIQGQHLIDLGQAHLPGRAGMFEGGEGTRARAAVIAADQNNVCVRLCHARRRHVRDHDLHAERRDLGAGARGRRTTATGTG